MRTTRLALALIAGLTGCDGGSTTTADGAVDEAGQSLSLLPITPKRITLVANQTCEVWINLSQRPILGQTVRVINNAAPHVDVAPLTLLYPKKEDQQSTTLTAVEPTSDQYMPITFELVGTKESRTIEVMVKLF